MSQKALTMNNSRTIGGGGGNQEIAAALNWLKDKATSGEIESYSKTNGYIRFANGIQIVFLYKTTDGKVENSNSLVRINFPVPFIDTTYAVCTETQRVVANAHRIYEKYTSYYVKSESDGNKNTVSHAVIAIGRWK